MLGKWGEGGGDILPSCHPVSSVLALTCRYHNRVHAADVLQSLHVLLTKGGLMPHYADPLTMMAAYVAAVRCC